MQTAPLTQGSPICKRTYLQKTSLPCVRGGVERQRNGGVVVLCYNGVITTEQPLSLHKCRQLPLHRGAREVGENACRQTAPLAQGSPKSGGKCLSADSSPYTGEPEKWGKMPAGRQLPLHRGAREAGKNACRQTAPLAQGSPRSGEKCLSADSSPYTGEPKTGAKRGQKNRRAGALRENYFLLLCGFCRISLPSSCVQGELQQRRLPLRLRRIRLPLLRLRETYLRRSASRPAYYPVRESYRLWRAFLRLRG